MTTQTAITDYLRRFVRALRLARLPTKGPRVQPQIVAGGDTVQIAMRNGTHWMARVSDVVWGDEGMTLHATEIPNYRYDRGCPHCCYIHAIRATEVWESCFYCGTKPVYR